MSAEDYLPDNWQAVLKGIYDGETFDGMDEERTRHREEMMEKQHPYESVKCPKCGGPMISRKSKHGVFWGCKAYPDCNGIRDNMGDARESRSEPQTQSSFKKK